MKKFNKENIRKIHKFISGHLVNLFSQEFS